MRFLGLTMLFVIALSGCDREMPSADGDASQPANSESPRTSPPPASETLKVTYKSATPSAAPATSKDAMPDHSAMQKTGDGMKKKKPTQPKQEHEGHAK